MTIFKRARDQDLLPMISPGLKSELIAASKNHSTEQLMSKAGFDYKVLFLNKIFPDPENARFLPSCIISDVHAQQFIKRAISKRQLVELYNAQNKVLVGKSCFINCLDSDNKERNAAAKNIESIIELAENIMLSEIIQVPTIYPLDDGTYRVLTGHRRFFAMIYAFGAESAAQFKVYKAPPLFKKIKQFQENASREDLSQFGKLESFLAAQQELETISSVKRMKGEKPLTVKEQANIMGISMGAYDNYNVLARYPCVPTAYQNGFSWPFTKMKKVVLSVEKDYKADKKLLNINDKRCINQQIKDIIEGNNAPVKSPQFKYEIRNIRSPEVLRKLLSVDVLSLDTGINWNDVDLADKKQCDNAMSQVLDYLEKSNLP